MKSDNKNKNLQNGNFSIKFPQNLQSCWIHHSLLVSKMLRQLFFFYQPEKQVMVFDPQPPCYALYGVASSSTSPI